MLFHLWTLFWFSVEGRENERLILVRKGQKKGGKKEKRIHTFAMVFPPLQEATSFVVRLQFFRPMWAVTPGDVALALHSKSLDRIVYSADAPKVTQNNFFFWEMKLTLFFFKRKWCWFRFDSATMINQTNHQAKMDQPLSWYCVSLYAYLFLLKNKKIIIIKIIIRWSCSCLFFDSITSITLTIKLT